MKKTKKETPAPPHADKGFLELAGEAMSVLGHEIVEGKDHLVSAASEKIDAVKKAIGKIGKKKAAAKKKVKAVAKKAPIKKAAAKKVVKAVKKVAKKAAKKITTKKAPAKKRK
jgi:hypothetical protein